MRSLRMWPVVASILVAACGGTSTENNNVAELIRQDGRVGTGAEAQSGRVVTVHYTGWLYDAARADH